MTLTPARSYSPRHARQANRASKSSKPREQTKQVASALLGTLVSNLAWYLLRPDHVFWYILWDSIKIKARLATSRQARQIRRHALAAPAGQPWSPFGPVLYGIVPGSDGKVPSGCQDVATVLPSQSTDSTNSTQSSRSTRRRRDPDAPHGRDGNGDPIAKYGYRRDGKPRATKPRVKRASNGATNPVTDAVTNGVSGGGCGANTSPNPSDNPSLKPTASPSAKGSRNPHRWLRRIGSATAATLAFIALTAAIACVLMLTAAPA